MSSCFEKADSYYKKGETYALDTPVCLNLRFQQAKIK